MKKSLADYIMTLIIAFVIFAVVAVFIVTFVQGLMSDVVDKVSNGESISEKNGGEFGVVGDDPEIDASDRDVVKTFLCLGLDASGENIDTMILVGINTTKKSLTCMLIPANTYSLINNTRYKIGDLYSSKGIAYIKNFVNTEIGLTPSHYFVMSPDKFGTLVDFLGGIDFDVNQKVDFSSDSDRLSLSKGSQHLNGDEAASLLTYEGYSKGRTTREDVQISFARAFCEKFLQPENVSKVKEMYHSILDGVATDLQPMEFVGFCDAVFNYPEFKENSEFLRAPGNSVSSGHYAVAASKATAKFADYK